jgi:hypothetical protein
VLYRTGNGTPVVLLYGSVPDWRTMSEGTTGQDVAQLNHDLVRLGYARAKGWAIVIPAEAWAGGLAAALAIGAIAGLLPAIRAARLSPTQALWSL